MINIIFSHIILTGVTVWVSGYNSTCNDSGPYKEKKK